MGCNNILIWFLFRRPRGRWEHDDRVGPDYNPQTADSPGMGRRTGRGRGRNVEASPQFSRKNAPHQQGRRNSSEWHGGGGPNKGPRGRDSESGWGSGSHRGQVSPQVYRRSSDPWGGDSRSHGDLRGVGNDQDSRGGQGPDRNMPEGAEVDRSTPRHKTQCV